MSISGDLPLGDGSLCWGYIGNTEALLYLNRQNHESSSVSPSSISVWHNQQQIQTCNMATVSPSTSALVESVILCGKCPLTSFSRTSGTVGVWCKRFTTAKPLPPASGGSGQVRFNAGHLLRGEETQRVGGPAGSTKTACGSSHRALHA